MTHYPTKLKFIYIYQDFHAYVHFWLLSNSLCFVFPQLAPDVSSAPTTVTDKIIRSAREIPTTAGEGKNSHFTCAF